MSYTERERRECWTERAYRLGEEARFEGQQLAGNPYLNSFSPLHREWARGWYSTHEALLDASTKEETNEKG